MMHTAKYMHQILDLALPAYDELFEDIDVSGLVENKGIIKDPRKRTNVLLQLKNFISEQCWVLCRLTESPIQGQKGNREYLIHCVPTGNSLNEEEIRKVVGD